MAQALPTFDAAHAEAPAASVPTAPNGAAPRQGGEPAAWLVSLVVHFLGLLALGTITIAVQRSADLVELSVNTVETIDVDAAPREFASSDREMEQIGALSAGGGSGAALAAATELSPESLVTEAEALLSEVGDRPAVDVDLNFTASRGPELSTEFAVQGSGSVGVTGAAGAIDRLTHEILASLEQRPTLVVWLFDQSGSLRDERKSIVKRFRRIYEELGVIEAANNPAFARDEAKPLLTAVVGFGESPVSLTAEPTDQIETIVRAVESIKDDKTGQENVFQAVGMVAEKFRPYESKRRGNRRVMIIVFTDEAGDDAANLDDTVDICRRLAMPVYVVGRPAPFGRDTAYVKWIDPDPQYDQRPQWVPVTLGPESLVPEALKLRFANGNDEELLDSGFGPYALTRLCYETGGLYFSTHPNRVVGRTVTSAETDNLSAHFTAFFDPDAMRRYQPDYLSAAEYMRQVERSRSRRALVEAARMTWTSPLEGVQLRFPKRDDAELAQLLSVAQRSAALLQPKLDLLCEVLLSGEADRQDEEEPRWQAGYDLALGRALAAKVRTDGYNMMLAEAKQGRAFERPRSNTWILEPAADFPASSLERLADEATDSLRRVVAEHPGTPWAMLAERELATPLGWRWDEGFTYLPPREPQNQNNNRPPRRERPPEPQGPQRRDPPPL
jgi:hypothetical protein